MIKARWAFRVIIMLAALFGILYAKKNIDSGSRGVLHDLFAPQIENQGSTLPKFTWCLNEVLRIEMGSNRAIERRDNRWFRVKPEPQVIPLDTSAIDTWLMENCSVVTESKVQNQNPDSTFNPIFIVAFKNGSNLVMLKNSADLFSMNSIQFASKQLVNALTELDALLTGVVKASRTGEN